MTTCAPVAVSLRQKFPIELASKVWRWLNDPRDFNFDDYGPQNYIEFARDLLRRLATEKTWAILADGEVVGYLGFVPQNPVAGQFHGMVIERSYRGRGIGREAMALAIQEVIGEGFVSLTSMPFWDNARIVALLKHCGFREVGMLHRATKRKGKLDAMRIMQYQEGI